jgi:hypothetical protein
MDEGRQNEAGMVMLSRMIASAVRLTGPDLERFLADLPPSRKDA